MKLKTFVISVAALFASAAAFALPNPCNGTFDDSSCMGPNAIRNMPIPAPPTVSKDQICGLIDCKSLSGTPTTINNTSVPAGYHEVAIATGPRFMTIAYDPRQLGLDYYKSIGYPSYYVNMYGVRNIGRTNPFVTGNIIEACSGDTNTRRTIRIGYPSIPDSDRVILCEPVGTRTILIKDAKNEIKNVTLAEINTFAIPGTIGVVTRAASKICKAIGYTDMSPIAPTYWYRGSGCDRNDTITYDNEPGWVAASACYNQVLTGMQCFR